MACVIFYVLSFIFCIALIYTSKVSEGYSAGYLSDCPGSNKTAIITKKSLKYITFTVQGPGDTLRARRIRYTYHQMKELAKDPDMNSKKPTAIYVGGYLDSPGFPLAWTIGKLYKDLGYNVLHLDSNRFTTVHYPVSVRYMKPLGRRAAEMLVELTNLGLINPKHIEMIGLSMGAHIVSFIAKQYKNLTGIPLSTIIGLDPSGPCYRNVGPEDRLDSSDGDFVNVIHTNIDGFGMAAPVGHVDFYVNGGEYQPGDVIWTPCGLMCSHIRSFTIWLSALQHPDCFIGMQCDSVQQARYRNCYDRQPVVTNTFGQRTDKTKRGIFYISTDNNFPYCLGVKGLSEENDFFLKLVHKMNREDVVKM